MLNKELLMASEGVPWAHILMTVGQIIDDKTVGWNAYNRLECLQSYGSRVLRRRRGSLGGSKC